MTQKLFLSFVSDTIKTLGKDFFDKNISEKEKLLKELAFDASELSNIDSGNKFIESTRDALLILGEEKSYENRNSVVLSVFMNYIREKVIPLYDYISTAFFIATANEKKLVLDKILSDDLTFTQLFKLFLQKATNEEVQSLFHKIFKKSNPSGDIIIVQSARECSPQLKSEIRNKYGNDCLVIFQVNTRLLGGMLIYKNGEISDTSWLGKISALKQLNNTY